MKDSFLITYIFVLTRYNLFANRFTGDSIPSTILSLFLGPMSLNMLSIVALIAYMQGVNISSYKYLLIVLGIIVLLIYSKQCSFLDEKYYSLRDDYERYDSFKYLKKWRLIIDFFLIIHTILWLIILVLIYHYLR